MEISAIIDRQHVHGRLSAITDRQHVHGLLSAITDRQHVHGRLCVFESIADIPLFLLISLSLFHPLPSISPSPSPSYALMLIHSLFYICGISALMWDHPWS